MEQLLEGNDRREQGQKIGPQHRAPRAERKPSLCRELPELSGWPAFQKKNLMRITLRDVRKQYGKWNANDGSPGITNGSIHGIWVKRCIVKAPHEGLAGYTVKTSGTSLSMADPRSTTILHRPSPGIGMLYQIPRFPPLTVLDNFMMDLTVTHFKRRGVSSPSQRMADPFGFHLDPIPLWNVLRWESGSKLELSGFALVLNC